MLDRLRAALRGRDELERRVRSLEEVLAEREGREEADLDQVVYDAVRLNTAVLERRMETLAADIDVLRSAVQGGKAHTEAAVEVAERKLLRRIDLVRRAIESGAAPLGGGGGGGGGGGQASHSPPTDPGSSPIDADLYVALEDRFRGEPALIEERQRHYLPYLGSLVDAEHPVLDIGSGRGEWLRILAHAEIPAAGVDSNPVAVAECREAGLRVVEADLAHHLDSLPDGSLGAVTMFQVVEHLPFPALVSALRSVARVLRPGGVLIAETPNALNLRVAATTFWIDPTHQRPLHPEVLVFLALETGFADVERLFVNRVGPEPGQLPGLPDDAAAALRRLLDDVDGAGDFCLVARTDPAGAPATGSAG